VEPKQVLKQNIEAFIKHSMGYSDPENRCRNCVSFMPDDCSGSQNAKLAHCKLNPAIDLPVQPEGFCRFFVAKGMCDDKQHH
jgi:hypothetical protein